MEIGPASVQVGRFGTVQYMDPGSCGHHPPPTTTHHRHVYTHPLKPRANPRSTSALGCTPRPAETQQISRESFVIILLRQPRPETNQCSTSLASSLGVARKAAFQHTAEIALHWQLSPILPYICSQRARHMEVVSGCCRHYLRVSPSRTSHS